MNKRHINSIDETLINVYKKQISEVEIKNYCRAYQDDNNLMNLLKGC